MRLDLSHLRQEETEFDRRYEPSAFAAGDAEFRVVAPIALHLTVHTDKDRFRLVGSVETVLELDCSRCLEAFAFPVERTFDLRYVPEGAPASGTGGEEEDDEVEVRDDDVSLTYYRDEAIDLQELLREQFYLALPMKPLCRPACLGICPLCGGNRNLVPCQCQPHWVDPRLARLKTLVTDRKSDDA